jgi:hypothetical protein
VIVAKYADHLPLHRQAKMFARYGVELSDQTLRVILLMDWTIMRFCTVTTLVRSAANRVGLGINASESAPRSLKVERGACHFTKRLLPAEQQTSIHSRSHPRPTDPGSP